MSHPSLFVFTSTCELCHHVCQVARKLIVVEQMQSNIGIWQYKRTGELIGLHVASVLLPCSTSTERARDKMDQSKSFSVFQTYHNLPVFISSNVGLIFHLKVSMRVQWPHLLSVNLTLLMFEVPVFPHSYDDYICITHKTVSRKNNF